MSHLAICAVPEPGHILPTVRVAKLLQARGHVVSYITVPRYESFFRSHQIPCRVIFSDMLPASYPENLFVDVGESSIRQLTTHYFNGNGDELIDELVLGLRDLRFECLLCDRFIFVTFGDVLINALPQAIILISILLPPHENAIQSGIPEIVLCPREIDIPQVADQSEAGLDTAFYAEPSVFKQRLEPAFPWGNIASGRPIVYCSFGTQYVRYKRATEILKTIIHAFSALPEYQLVLVAGSLFNELNPEDLPNNVIMVHTAPQLNLLKHSKLFITHGGLGGIKEAVMSGVPMLVIPFDKDQPNNAARVVYHKLGQSCDTSQYTPESIKQLVQTMLESKDICDGLAHMQRIFRDREAQAPSIPFIEQILAAPAAY
jgi:UDP:flavonoid glycosyltransferase YjiC (YdhE family)